MLKVLFSLFSGLPAKEKARLKPLETKIGYSFKDKTLLKRALTHKSFANEQKLSSLDQNERYEFLGDAVLELAISQLIMNFFPESSEGELSKLRAAVVNEDSLASLARKMNLGHFLYLGKGEEQCDGRSKASLLADAYEAVLGAVYLDSGFGSAFQVIAKQFKKLLTQATEQDIIRDFKTKLQEEAQNRFKAIPKYHLTAETGPDHDKTFAITLTIKDEVFGRGKDKSKKQAEQMAAREALAKWEKT